MITWNVVESLHSCFAPNCTFPLQNNGHSPNAQEEDADNLLWAQENWMQSELCRNRKEKKKKKKKEEVDIHNGLEILVVCLSVPAFIHHP